MRVLLLLPFLLFTEAAAADTLADCLALDPDWDDTAVLDHCPAFLDAPATPEERALLMTQIGLAHLSRDEPADFTEAQQLSAGNAALLSRLAEAHLTGGDAEGAEALATEALALQDNGEGRLLRCRIRQESFEYTQALEDCSSALATLKTAEAAVQTAQCQNALARHEEAYATASAAFTLPGADVRIYREAVLALQFSGREAEAKVLLDTALGLYPEDEDLLWRRDALP